MKMKKIISITASAALLLTMAVGCSSTDSGSSSSPSSNSSSPSTADSAAVIDFSGATVTGQVESINGSEITLTLGTSGIGGMGGGNMGGAPGAGGGGGGDDAGSPPDMSNETTDSADTADTTDTTGDAPNTEDNGNEANMPSGGGNFGPDSSATVVTITVNDESILSIQSDSETESASLSDIEEGSTLTITFGTDGEISSIVISSQSSFSPSDMSAPEGTTSDGEEATDTEEAVG